MNSIEDCIKQHITFGIYAKAAADLLLMGRSEDEVKKELIAFSDYFSRATVELGFVMNQAKAIAKSRGDEFNAAMDYIVEK